MTIWTTLKHFVSRQASTPAPWDDYWYTDPLAGVRIPSSGLRVTPDRAQQLTTISACVKVITEAVITAPLIVYREVPDGKERAHDTPLAKLLRVRPNRWQHSLAWLEMMTGHAALRGMGYSEMVGRSMDDLELIPRHPDRVRVLESDDSGFTTMYGVKDWRTGIEHGVPAHRMFVLCGPWSGRSPLVAHQETISLGLAMQNHAARYFRNGSKPGGLLKGPEGSRFTKEQRKDLKDSWEEAHGGPDNPHRVAVLEGGLEWQQVGLDNTDSQFIEQRQFHVPELCRIWGVPPYKVQEYGRATWGNTEQMAIDFLQTCMLPWYRRWEAAISWHLIDEVDAGEDLYAEFLFEGLLRADTQTRYAAYQIATGGKAWMSPNEVRTLENLNKEDGYDEISKDTQGAAPNQQNKNPQQKQPNQGEAGDVIVSRVWTFGDGDKAPAVWNAWAESTAESLAKTEAQERERAPKDPKLAQAYMAEWYASRFHAIVQQKLAPMRSAWAGPHDFDTSVMLILGGVLFQPNRKAAIINALTQGETNDLAA